MNSQKKSNKNNMADFDRNICLVKIDMDAPQWKSWINYAAHWVQNSHERKPNAIRRNKIRIAF
jgi:hypothetical protein